MKYVNLGKSGLKVSRIALGCMSFGVEARAWRLDQLEAPYIPHAASFYREIPCPDQDR